MSAADDLQPGLRRQWFDRPTDDLTSAVEHLAGMNAQAPRGSSVGLWSRVADFDQQRLDDQLGAGRLVKANLLRGIVHLVTADQFRRWRLALQPALERTVEQFCPRLWHEVDRDELLRVGTDLLAEHHPRGLTRVDLTRELEPHFPRAEPSELAFAVRLLAPVVQVPDPSSWSPGQPRYVLAETVVPGPWLAPEDGLDDLVAAHLRAHGPATAADVAGWSGLSGLGSVLDRVGTRVGGRRAPRFDLPEGERPDAARVPRVVVVPEYDQIYFAHRNGPLEPARRRLIPNTAGLMHGSVLLDGRVKGAWAKGVDGVPDLLGWGRLPAVVDEEFARFVDWYLATDRRVRDRLDGDVPD